jgi:hypothetical protein
MVIFLIYVEDRKHKFNIIGFIILNLKLRFYLNIFLYEIIMWNIKLNSFNRASQACVYICYSSFSATVILIPIMLFHPHLRLISFCSCWESTSDVQLLAQFSTWILCSRGSEAFGHFCCRCLQLLSLSELFMIILAVLCICIWAVSHLLRCSNMRLLHICLPFIIWILSACIHVVLFWLHRLNNLLSDRDSILESLESE